ncbi:PucR family transcriptional regulator [Microbacterium sp. RD1]|uniref:PucR family transcriptional regulator n=1 Tax=Microbacterium sp. RD1 TaxID=3457313 RepID=UPI003FA53740
MTASRRGVTLRDLLTAHDGGGLTPHHLPAHAQSVRDIVLVTDVDRILSVGPDSVVLLGEELALGGWVVSVALRYAWERRAVALIVSDSSISDTVVELARRFGVGLFTTAAGIDRTALELARELGALEAGVLTRLDALHARVVRATTPAEVLAQVSQELGDARVDLLIGGISLWSVGSEAENADEIRIPLSPGSPRELAVRAPKAQLEIAAQVLSRAAPTLRALLLAQEIDDLAGAAPLLSFTALTGLRDPELDEVPLPSGGPVSPWPAGAPVAAVVLSAARNSADHAGRVGPLLSSHWRATFPRAPLARTQSGWFAFLPLENAAFDVHAPLDSLARTALRGLGLAIGVAADADGTVETGSLLRRAWLAARLAEPEGEVIDFHRMGMAMVERLLPPDVAHDIAETALPLLTADPHAPEVIGAVLAYLDCAGSVVGAAERLGIHRNTMQARLRRAAELGLRLDDPDQLLPTHLLLASFARGQNPPSSANTDI